MVPKYEVLARYAMDYDAGQGGHGAMIKLREVFGHVDEDHSGTISCDEFVAWLDDHPEPDDGSWWRPLGLLLLPTPTSSSSCCSCAAAAQEQLDRLV